MSMTIEHTGQHLDQLHGAQLAGGCVACHAYLTAHAEAVAPTADLDPTEADPAEAEPAVETRFFDIENISREGFTYRNHTRADVNIGRELAIYTDRNGAAIVVLFVDGFYVNQAEYTSAELAMLGDYA